MIKIIFYYFLLTFIVIVLSILSNVFALPLVPIFFILLFIVYYRRILENFKPIFQFLIDYFSRLRDRKFGEDDGDITRIVSTRNFLGGLSFLGGVILSFFPWIEDGGSHFSSDDYYTLCSLLVEDESCHIYRNYYILGLVLIVFGIGLILLGFSKQQTIVVNYPTKISKEDDVSPLKTEKELGSLSGENIATFCPECGAKNEKGGKFCRNCGTNLSQS